MEWDAPHIHGPKDRDWFASLIIVAGALVFVASLTHDWILAALIISFAIVIIMTHAREHGPLSHIQIRTGGVVDGDVFYPWKNIHSFNIVEYHGVARLILLPNKQLAIKVMIPLSSEVDPDDLHITVEEFIPYDEKLKMSLLHILLEKLGI
jgi:hypothetical protein